MYVCLCKSIRETEFQNMLVRHGASAETIRDAMGLDESCCGRCEAQMEQLIERIIHTAVHEHHVTNDR